MLAIPKTAPMSPCHFPRSAGGKMSPMTVKVLDMRTAAPAPCTPLKIMSWSMSWDMPANADPSRNTPIPTMNISFRPYMSDIRPTTGTRDVDITRYAATTQDIWLIPPRSVTILAATRSRQWSCPVQQGKRLSMVPEEDKDDTGPAKPAAPRPGPALRRFRVIDVCSGLFKSSLG